MGGCHLKKPGFWQPIFFSFLENYLRPLEVDLNSNHPMDFSMISKLPLEDRQDLENTLWKINRLVAPGKLANNPVLYMDFKLLK